MMNKLQVQILAYNPSDAAPWVRVIVDECHLWAVFGDTFNDVIRTDAEPMNITSDPEFLQGYVIREVRVYEVGEQE
jgi:hypothetical protein